MLALQILTTALPISALRSQFAPALGKGPVVISSPTGSGKSTEVPRWCEGPVLVVEPRRVACRSLASRVAELEGTPVGQDVGYIVRDEHTAHEATRIVFATPGMVLRNRALLAAARTVILDEFHERSIDLDLLLALLLSKRSAALVILSATIEGDRVAKHVAGTHLQAQGRAFDVDLRHPPGQPVLPEAAQLPARVAQALGLAANDPGDVLVFLPGKAEIEACASVLRGNYAVLPLHGGLSLQEQHRTFEPSKTRKVILATNVAETSLTIPGIGVVIDAGLVRQSRYQAGRGFLTLMPIAADSAAQRAGRAGRTAAGVCYRLWSASAQLSPNTVPEIHRESLVPLVLTAAAWGTRVEDLPLLDEPKPYALEAARAELQAWGALEGPSALTPRGRDLFELPIDPAHARLLSEAKREECVEDMVDLVAVLSVGRPLFTDTSVEVGIDADLKRSGCDVTASIQALRATKPEDHGAAPWVVREARLTRDRLRRQLGLAHTAPLPIDRPVAREALVRAALAADPRLAHVARTRGRQVFFSNGGTEIELARESAVQHVKDVQALLALDTRAFGSGRDARVLVTCATAVPLSVLARAGLGADRTLAVKLERHRVFTTTLRHYAGALLSEREQEPRGEALHAALVELLERGSLFRNEINLTRERLMRLEIAAWLAQRGHPAGVPSAGPVPDVATWLRARVAELGLQSNDDLPLLSGSDFLAPELPFEARAAVESDYPLSVNIAGVTYRAEYDLPRNQVTLHPPKGARTQPPAPGYLPKFPGLRVLVDGPRGIQVIRARG